MAIIYGVTQTGFVMPQLVDLQAQINDNLQAGLGADINTSATAVFGQISGTVAEQLATLWQGLQDVYNSSYPDTSFGASLDNVGAITAIARFNAISSTVASVKLFGTAGTLVPATTTQFGIAGQPTSIFLTDTAITLIAGQNCIQSISFSLVPDAGTWTLTINGSITSDLAFNANAAAVQAAVQLLLFCGGCTVTGDYTAGFTSTFNGAATGGLMGQPLFSAVTTLTSSGTPVVITPMITQAGLDQGTVNVTALNPGPLVCNIGTLTSIVTPIQGLTNVINPNDAVVGRNVESDNAYRIRRSQELQILGGSTFNALVSKLYALSDVTAVVLFENYSNTTDGNGLPPHSFEAFVEGGTAAEIGAVIFGTKPVGIEPYGTQLVTVLDSQGNPHDMYYSVPTLVPVYIIAAITPGSLYPANGDALVVDALYNYGQTLTIGQTLIVSPQLIATLINIAGIESVTLYVGTSPGPTMSNNITFASNQVGSFDPTRISVTHV